VVRRIVSLLIAFPLGVVLVAIAVSNRQPVQLVLDPFRPETPALAVSLPFYAYLLGALVVGVVLGGLATWLGQARWRKTARAQGRRAARWQAEADRLAKVQTTSVVASQSRDLAVAGR
jgi:uncharacterized integral membrane protein